MQGRRKNVEDALVDSIDIERATLKPLEVTPQLSAQADVEAQLRPKLSDELFNAKSTADTQFTKRRLPHEPRLHQRDRGVVRSRRRSPLQEGIKHLRQLVRALACLLEVANWVRMLAAGVADGVVVE